jgi:hypothetical protein
MDATSDREMMRRLGISDLILHDILSKSRQAIHMGLMKEVRYFRLSELRLLYLYVKQRLGDKVETFERYLKETRPDSEVQAITTLYGLFENPSPDSADGDAVIVTPDFLYLRHENRSAAEYLLAIPELCDSVRYFVADDRERDALKSALLERWPDPIAVNTIADVAALPYLVFFRSNGLRDTKGYALSDGYFREMPSFRTNQILERVLIWSGEKSHERGVLRARKVAG